MSSLLAPTFALQIALRETEQRSDMKLEVATHHLCLYIDRGYQSAVGLHPTASKTTEKGSLGPGPADVFFQDRKNEVASEELAKMIKKAWQIS